VVASGGEDVDFIGEGDSRPSLQRSFRNGWLHEGRLRKISDNQAPGRVVAAGEMSEHRTPLIGAANGRIGAGGMNCDRRELNQKGVPRMLLMRLQGAELGCSLAAEARKNIR
jgi:hypothetical protein